MYKYISITLKKESNKNQFQFGFRPILVFNGFSNMACQFLSFHIT